ncbi:ribonuclease H-like domain-containing protein [Fomitopsis betulina]|nr:ribonuclease H-like domain-containing protein [Fomitopsis betulina]
MKAEVKGCYVTGQCDGWKNISKDHIIATIINTEYMTYLVSMFCITKECKTTENLLEIVLNQIKYFTEVLQVKVVAWCTDASGDGSKMCCLLVQRMPWLFVVDCWAHQINLVTGDVLKRAASMFKDLLDDALEVIKWFNNHMRMLGILKDTMEEKFGKALCLILPVITHWTSHYLAVQRLIDVERAFRQLFLDDWESELVLCAGEKEEEKEKARNIMEKLKEPEFFSGLRRLSEHLAPLAIATNLFQSDHTRLDVVLITLAKLYQIFSDNKYDLTIRRAILASLEKWWAKQDQAIFILAVIFNPYIRVSAFSRESPFRQADEIQNLAVEAYRRFYRCEPNNEFRTSIVRYLHKQSPYTDEQMGLEHFKQEAKAKGTHVNLVELWRSKVPIQDDYDDQDAPRPPLNGAAGFASLALLIACIVPNTA